MKKALWILPVLIVGTVLIKWNSFGRLSDFEAGVAGDGDLNVALERIRDSRELPAIAAVLVHRGKIVETGAVGVRAVGAPERVTTGDRWHLGSISKSMTATLVAVLVEEGVVDWNTTVHEIFPDFADSTRPEYADVRLEELLSHTSGLPHNERDVPSFSSFQNSKVPLREQRRKWAAELLALAPETSRGMHLYGNGNYVVAGAMLEEVTGELWEDLMVRKVFTPLNMTSTGFGPPGIAGNTPNEPKGHLRKQDRLLPLQPGPGADNPAAVGPAGTIHSTLSDAALYMAEHLAGSRGNGGFVSAESFAKLHSQAPNTAYSLGWNIREHSHSGGRVLYHHGSNRAWYATMWVAPKRDFAILTVTNAGDTAAGKGADDVLRAIMDRCNAAFD